MSGGEIHLPGITGCAALKGNPLAVRGPTRQKDRHRRESELKALAAVHLGPPQGAFGKGNIRAPLAVSREIHKVRSDTRKVGHELTRLGIVADQFAAWL